VIFNFYVVGGEGRGGGVTSSFSLNQGPLPCAKLADGP
jgi:hypothetical protein